MPNGTYGGVRGRKTKVGGKLTTFVFLLLYFISLPPNPPFRRVGRLRKNQEKPPSLTANLSYNGTFTPTTIYGYLTPFNRCDYLRGADMNIKYEYRWNENDNQSYKMVFYGDHNYDWKVWSWDRNTNLVDLTLNGSSTWTVGNPDLWPFHRFFYRFVLFRRRLERDASFYVPGLCQYLHLISRYSIAH